MSGAADGATPSRSVSQPFTFGGLAAFARGRLGLVLLAQLITALLIGGSVVRFLQHAYVPVIQQAIQEMPETARISEGHLIGVSTTIIAETKLLAIAVTPEHDDSIGQSADIQIQFRISNVRVGSVFRPDWGWEFDYGRGFALDLSRSYLDPWWGAWHPVFLAAAGVAVLLSLCCIWAALAFIYTLPAKFLAWFADRQLTWGGAWRLGATALLPGALLMGFSVFLYGAQRVDLIGLAFCFVAHLLVGWVYLIGGTLGCPRLEPEIPKHNPFVS